MSIWFGAWLTLAAGMGLVWVFRLALTGRVLRRRDVLHENSHANPPPNPPLISVLVAARDEEENIRTCVTSLLDQDYPALEVIAVDDRSRDKTPQILAELEQQAQGRLKVRTVQELPAGWFGKSNAMRVAVENSSGEWLLFTDADCRQLSTQTIGIAVQYAIAHGVDLLSITPTLEARTLWERIVQPACTVVLMIWFLPDRVNNPSKKAAYANGAFMLFRRSCYEAIGGHANARSSLNEDMHLARLVKRAGLRLRVVGSRGLYVTRMYGTALQAWRGWSRLFRGCLETTPRIGTAAFFVLLFSLMPWLSLIVAAVGWAAYGSAASAPWLWAVLAWGGVVAVLQLTMGWVYPSLSSSRWWSMTYPLGAAATLGVLLNAMIQAAGVTSTHWRGTRYGAGAKMDARKESLQSGRIHPADRPAA